MGMGGCRGTKGIVSWAIAAAIVLRCGGIAGMVG
jgi:hypothetical protein